MRTSHSDSSNAKKIINVMQEEKQVTYIYREMGEGVRCLQKELVLTKNLIGNDGSSNIGKTLIKAGTCLIAFPEPIISDIVGTALVVSGLALNRLTKRDNVRDLYRKYQKNLQDIQHFQREISQTTFFK